MTFKGRKIWTVALTIFVVFSAVGLASPLFATSLPGLVQTTKLTVGDSSQIFAIADTNYLQGGHMQVPNLTAMESITPERRSVGMLVTVMDADSVASGNQTVTYRLVSNPAGTTCPSSAGDTTTPTSTVTNNSLDGGDAGGTGPCAYTIYQSSGYSNWSIVIPAISSSNIGQYLTTTDGVNYAWGGVASGAGSGSVSSVALSLPSIFTVSGSPVTSAGTLSATLANEATNTVFAGPSSGSSGVPTFRALVNADLPSLAASSLLGNPTGSSSTPSAITLGYGLAFNGSSLAISTFPGNVWTSATSTVGNQWSAVTYGNGMFVALNNNGTSSNEVMTSPDGVNWLPQSIPAVNTWTGITYGNGLFVAVGSSGSAANEVMTSPDGVHWTDQTAASTTAWSSVAYGNGTFVAVSNTYPGTMMSSPDGVHWTTQTSPASNAWNSVTYGNGKFVAVGAIGTTSTNVTYSTDGITWSDTSVSTPNVLQWRSVVYGNGMYVAVATNGSTSTGVMYSTDGVTWSSAGEAATAAVQWISVTYGNGVFAAVSFGATTSTDLMISHDGINWTTQVNPAASDWSSVAYGNGTFVAVAHGGTMSNDVMTSGVAATTSSQNNNIYQGGLTVNGTVDLSSLASGVVHSNASGVLTSSAVGLTTDVSGILPLANGGTGANLTAPLATSLLGYDTTDGSSEFLTIGSGLSYNHSTHTLSATGGSGSGTVTSVDGSGGTTGLTLTGGPITTSGTLTLGGTLGIANGGTGQVTATAAFNALAPSQTGASGQFLTTNGTTTSWAAALTNALTNGDILVGNSSNVATAVAVSGDATLSNTGVLTIGANAITTSKINAGAVTYAKLQAESSTTLLGNPTGSATSPSEITLGTGLAFSGTTLGLSSGFGTKWTSRTVPTANSWNGVTYGNGEFVAVSNGGTTSNAIITSPDGINWTNQSNPVSSQWNAVTYGNGIFVTVRQSGSSTTDDLMTSTDGVTWTPRTVPAPVGYDAVTYGNGLFIATGLGSTSNGVLTSPDGINWTARTTPVANINTSITYGNGLFVVLGYGGTTSNDLMTSPDGITWTNRTIPSANLWHSVTYGNGLFVAVSQDGTTSTQVMTSPDGITWTARTEPATAGWQSVAYGNGLFTAVAASGSTTRTMTSPDGITWTDQTIPTGTTNAWRSITYANGMFVAMASSGTTADQIMTSGVPTVSTVQNNNMYQGGLTVAGSIDLTSLTAGLVQSSASGVLSTITSPVSNTVFGYDATDNSSEYFTLGTGLTYSHSTHTLSASGSGSGEHIGDSVASGAANEVLFTDGSTTLAQSANFAFTNGTNPILSVGDVLAAGHSTTIKLNDSTQTIAFNAGSSSLTLQSGVSTLVGGLRISALGGATGGLATTSTSGGLGTLANVNVPGDVLTIDGSGNPHWAPVGAGVSTLGTWVDQTSANFGSGPASYNSVAYGGGKYVAVGAYSSDPQAAAYSTDGVTWTQDSPSGSSGQTWASVAYGGGKFVAVSTTGHIMTSTDGITWTLQTNPTITSLRGIAYGGGLFVAVGYNGSSSTSNVLTSPDGVTWTARTSTEPFLWFAVTYGGGKFVAAAALSGGASGTTATMYSSDGITWSNSGTFSAAMASISSIAYGGGVYVATAYAAGGASSIEYSTDGAAWTAATTPSSPAIWSSVTYGAGVFVAVANNTAGGTTVSNDIVTSTDGINWTTMSSPGSVIRNWTGVTYGNSMFVAVASDGTTSNQIMTSPVTTTGAIGGLTIGGAITGGTPNEILYADGSGDLAQSVNLAFTNGTNPLFSVGDIAAAGNGTKFTLDDSSSSIAAVASTDFSYKDNAGNLFLDLNPSSDEYQIGDVGGAHHGAKIDINDSIYAINLSAGTAADLNIDDAAQQITATVPHFVVNDTAGNSWFDVASNDGSISMGDVGGIANRTVFSVDDVSQSIAASASGTFEVFNPDTDSVGLEVNFTNDQYGIGDLLGSEGTVAGLFVDGTKGFNGINTIAPGAALEVKGTFSGAAGDVSFSGTGLDDISVGMADYTGGASDTSTETIVGVTVTLTSETSMSVGDTVTDDSSGATAVVTSASTPTYLLTYTSSGDMINTGDSITDDDTGESAGIGDAVDRLENVQSADGETDDYDASSTPTTIGTQGIQVSYTNLHGHFAGDTFTISAGDAGLFDAIDINNFKVFNISGSGALTVHSDIDNSLYGGIGHSSGQTLIVDQNQGVYGFGDLSALNQGEAFAIHDGGPSSSDWVANLSDNLGAYFQVAPSSGHYAFGDISNAYGGTSIVEDDSSGSILSTVSSQFAVADLSGNRGLLVQPQDGGNYALGDIDGAYNSSSIYVKDSASSINIYADNQIIAGDVGGDAFLKLDIPDEIYSLGDISGSNNGTQVSVDDGDAEIDNYARNFTVIDTDTGGTNEFIGGGSFDFGDLSDVGNGSTFILNDSAKIATLTVNNSFAVSDTSGNSYLSINQAGATYAIGDLSNSNHNTTLTVDDTDHEIDINGDLYVSGSVSDCVLGTATGGVTCASDARLKKNVQDLPSELASIDQLRPVTFNWIDPTKDQSTQTGFIAQDVQTIYPQFVHDVGNGFIGIDYASLVVPAIKAIQELDMKVEPLSSLDVSNDNSLAGLIRQYLENALNGIGTIFVGKVQTNELCLQDVCVTKDQLQTLLNNAGASSAANNTGGGSAAPVSGGDSTASPADDGSDATASAPADDVSSSDSTASAPADPAAGSPATDSTTTTPAAPDITTATPPASSDSSSSTPSDPGASAPSGQ